MIAHILSLFSSNKLGNFHKINTKPSCTREGAMFYSKRKVDLKMQGKLSDASTQFYCKIWHIFQNILFYYFLGINWNLYENLAFLYPKKVHWMKAPEKVLKHLCSLPSILHHKMAQECLCSWRGGMAEGTTQPGGLDMGSKMKHKEE